MRRVNEEALLSFSLTAAFRKQEVVLRSGIEPNERRVARLTATLPIFNNEPAWN